MTDDRPTTKKRILNLTGSQDARETAVRRPSATTDGVTPPPIAQQNMGERQPENAKKLADDRAELQLATTAWVFFARGQNQGQLVELSQDYIPIGRTKGCSIIIEDSYSSTIDTLIIKRDNRWLLCDIAAPGVIGVNEGTLGKDVTAPHSLQDGDHITIGKTELIFKRV